MNLKQNPYNGFLIAFEGIDGTGKTLQAKRLVGNLAKDSPLKGFTAIYTYEPWWGRMTKKDLRLRDALSGKIPLNPEEIQILMIDNRRRHLEQEVVPFLEQKRPIIVATDRYFLSTLAYGAATSSEFTFEELIGLHERMPAFFLPDLTLIFDASIDIAMQRMNSGRAADQESVFEKRYLLEKVRERYLDLAVMFQDNDTVIIDASKSKEDVLQDVLASLKDRIERKIQARGGK